jgi:uncharacterized protein YxjI
MSTVVIHGQAFSVSRDVMVTDTDGADVLLVDGTALSMATEVQLWTPDRGRRLAVVRADAQDVRPRMVVEDGRGRRLAEVVATRGRPRPQAVVAWTSGDRWDVTGDDTRLHLVDDRGHDVARVEEDWRSGSRSHGLQVEDGYDVALVVAVVLAVEALTARPDAR